MKITAQTSMLDRFGALMPASRFARIAVAVVLALTSMLYTATVYNRVTDTGKADALGAAQYSAGGTWFALCKTYRNDPTYGPQWDVTVLLDRGDPAAYATGPTSLGKWGLAFYTVRYDNGYSSGEWRYTASEKALDQWMHNGANGHDWMALTLPISGLLHDGVQVAVGSDSVSPWRAGGDPWVVPPGQGPSQSGIFIPGDTTAMPTC